VIATIAQRVLQQLTIAQRVLQRLHKEKALRNKHADTNLNSHQVLASTMLVLTPVEALAIGFRHAKGSHDIANDDSNIKNMKEFKRHYGSSPTIVAIMWADIQETDAEMGEKDKSEKGFKKSLTAIHFIWACPKNASILASTFGMSVRQAQGENLWKWVKAVAKLKDHKFVWPEDEHNNPNSHVFIIAVDGVDFKAREKNTQQCHVTRVSIRTSSIMVH
jgi:hypothetical protein